MKSSTFPPKNVELEDWQLLDDCPVCRLIKSAILEGRYLSKKELSKAFAEAEAESLS